MSKIELKPCPFCGGEVRFKKGFLASPKVENRKFYGMKNSSNFLTQEYHIECKKCGFATRDCDVHIEIADEDCLKLAGDFWENETITRITEEWNRRAG